MIAARIATLIYLFVAAFGGGVALPQSSVKCARIAPASTPSSTEVQPGDDDSDDDDDVGDIDFDDDLVPSAPPQLADVARESGRLVIADVLAPASAPRDSLFRPPRAFSA